MPPVPAPAPFTDADYEMIAAAVLETSRGRWFLTEYAKRNRQADTKLVLEAIEKLERSLTHRSAVPEPERMRVDLIEMLNAIARTKSEIAALKPTDADSNHLDQASSELDSIVDTTEQATSDILAAAERVQEIAWTLREQGVDASICDLIDAHATEVYMSCSFQDITGQRTRKVIEVLRFLEARIDAMIRIWRLDDIEFGPSDENQLVAPKVRGPQETGDRLKQHSVDQLIGNERRPDIAWNEARIKESRDPRNLGQFELDDLVAFETSADAEGHAGNNSDAPVQVQTQPLAPDTSIPQQAVTMSAQPKQDASDTGEAKKIESLTFSQRMALFG